MKKAGLFRPARLLFYVISLVIFYLAIRYVGKLRDIRLLLAQMSAAWFVLAVTAQIITYWLNVMILRTLLHGQTGRAGIFILFKLSIVILFVNQALPTGGISGNGYLFRQLVKRKVPVRKAYQALVLESFTYYVAFVILLTALYAWHRHLSGSQPVMTYTVAAGCVFFSCLGALMLMISHQRTISYLLPKLNRVHWLKRYIAASGLLALVKRNRTDWKDIIKIDRSFIQAVCYQMGILVCDAVTIFAIVHGFHVSLHPALILYGLLLSLVIGSLPISPGALIAYESAMTYFYTLLGLPVHAALIVTLLFRFFSFWIPIPVGLALYRNLRHH
ncbi:lysylphosphatidylglycerol synthase transmembrane domain-containing protein [Mucilaginibacter aquariorum]|uniref:Flippase-like domain-containing protein n=1 Tax=Mucilaginibacter aquariorum TaxID=2967225 RepID=A0ABT1T289_9SPHI|nr:lysylphosphatidylglycerol synthase transmembrane domain-containing protein [Mucilaginibacter aquariorum]MCQ6958728.1 flippase-like domain-containing protein [Mucilaginibacter aquariorum]